LNMVLSLLLFYKIDLLRKKSKTSLKHV